MIRFQLWHADQVNLTIYNILGQKIDMLVNGEMTPGPYSVIWDGKDATGREVASGVYFVRLAAGEKVEPQKNASVPVRQTEEKGKKRPWCTLCITASLFRSIAKGNGRGLRAFIQDRHRGRFVRESI